MAMILMPTPNAASDRARPYGTLVANCCAPIAGTTGNATTGFSTTGFWTSKHAPRHLTEAMT